LGDHSGFFFDLLNFPMSAVPNDRVLHRFAVFTALTTLALIGLGGMVTSKGAGMAVPDWPTTYGQNMFLFPFSQWVGGVLYEHSHRLLGSAVGLLTAILAIWFWGRHAAGLARGLGFVWILLGMGLIGVRTQHAFVALASVSVGVVIFCLFKLRCARVPVMWWALLAYSLVLIQGTLGGLRVTLFKDEIGIVHGTIAQLFFMLICSLALVTSRFWRRISELQIASANGVRGLFLKVTLVILLQLILGASMRHQHAGLAVPDFPLAYGKVWPPADSEFVAKVNQERMDPRGFNDITAGGIHLHMTHRVLALTILGLVVWCCVSVRRVRERPELLVRGADFWLGLICLQAILGASTVWSNKSAEIATLHVVMGAFCLVWGGLLTIVAFRVSRGGSAVGDTEPEIGAEPLLAAGSSS
jgi:cytochrome c oxidase assembly protein subunit 15